MNKAFLRHIGRYFLNVLISLDQLGNSLLLGDPDETISSRLGRIKRKWGGQIPRRRVFARTTDWILDKLDPGHSSKSIEEDEGDNGLVDKPETK